MKKVTIGIAIGVVGSAVALFVLTFPFSFFFLQTTIDGWRGLPCSGLC